MVRAVGFDEGDLAALTRRIEVDRASTLKGRGERRQRGQTGRSDARRQRGACVRRERLLYRREPDDLKRATRRVARVLNEACVNLDTPSRRPYNIQCDEQEDEVDTP